MKRVLFIAVILLLFTSSAFAWTNMQEYTETINDPQKNMAVNEYVYRISAFIKQKCPPEYCKHVLIVGDDFVIPMERKIIETENGPQLIYSDGIYNVTTNRGVGELQDILEGETKIALVVPSTMDARFRQAIDNMKNNMATQYGLDPSVFEEHTDTQVNCSVNKDHVLWNKSVLLVGENNALLNCSQFWKDTPQVFDTFPSPWGYQANPKKQVILIKTNKPELVEDAAFILTYDNVNKNFRGSILDTDGDGWTDEEELFAHTDPQNKFDNICTKLPGIKTFTEGLDDLDYWADMSNRLLNGQFKAGMFGTQSILIGGASEFGKLYGMYAGIAAGARDDYKFVTADFWSLAGTIVIASLNTDNQAATMAFLDGVFTDTLATQCAAARHGVNVGDNATQFYFSDVLPSIYKEADNTSPILPVILDEADRNAFNNSFVAGYHVGYIGEQVAIGKGVDEALKSLKLGRLLKVAKLPEDLALELIGKFKTLEWTNAAKKGLTAIIGRTGDDAIAKLALEEYDSVAAKTMLESAGANTKSVLQKGVNDVPDVMTNVRVSNGTRFTQIGSSQKVFLADKSYYQEILDAGITGSQIKKSYVEKIEALLGLRKGTLSQADEIAVIDVPNVKARQGFRKPLLEDAGTNPFFMEGGATLGGVPERVINGPITVTPDMPKYLTVVPD